MWVVIDPCRTLIHTETGGYDAWRVTISWHELRTVVLVPYRPRAVAKAKAALDFVTQFAEDLNKHVHTAST